MNECKNQISILRNILQKSNDKHLIDYVFKKILPEIFDFYMENYINPNIIYSIDDCYKLYFTDLYNELSKNYNLTTQDTLIFRKKYERVIYIIKLLKDKNIYVKDYKKEAIRILLTPNITNYSMYIDNLYLNKNRKSKKCSNCNKYHTNCNEKIRSVSCTLRAAGLMIFATNLLS